MHDVLVNLEEEAVPEKDMEVCHGDDRDELVQDGVDCDVP